MGDAEAVRLVAHMLHHAQRFRIFVDIQRHTVARKINLLQTLRYAHNRYGASQPYLFRLSELPRHIECFDNSNIQGTNPVASCVVFRDGRPAKRDGGRSLPGL